MQKENNALIMTAEKIPMSLQDLAQHSILAILVHNRTHSHILAIRADRQQRASPSRVLHHAAATAAAAAANDIGMVQLPQQAAILPLGRAGTQMRRVVQAPPRS